MHTSSLELDISSVKPCSANRLITSPATTHRISQLKHNFSFHRTQHNYWLMVNTTYQHLQTTDYCLVSILDTTECHNIATLKLEQYPQQTSCTYTDVQLITQPSTPVSRQWDHQSTNLLSTSSSWSLTDQRSIPQAYLLLSTILLRYNLSSESLSNIFSLVRSSTLSLKQGTNQTLVTLSLSDHRANKLDDKTISSKPHTTYRNNSSKPLYKANNTIQGTIYTVQYKQSLYTTLSQQQQQPLTSAWKVTQIINNMAPTAPSTLALNLG